MMWSERGSALVLALIAVCMLAALGASLAILSNTELKIAANYADAAEVRYAAEAAMEVVIQDLAAAGDWHEVLVGPALSVLADGLPNGRRTLADGSRIDLDQLSSDALSDNPTFRLYAFAPAERIQPGEAVGVDAYALVWIGDDTEPDPAILAIRAEAFGASGLRRRLAARVVRTEDGEVRILSWQELR